jgi:hypothetical protein
MGLTVPKRGYSLSHKKGNPMKNIIPRMPAKGSRLSRQELYTLAVANFLAAGEDAAPFDGFDWAIVKEELEKLVVYEPTQDDCKAFVEGWDAAYAFANPDEE